MRYGANPLEVIEAVKEEIPRIVQLLPEGVTIRPFYDRSNLIRGAIATVQESLFEEVVIVAVVLGLFLWSVSSTLIITIGLLVGVLITFIFMYFAGISSNIMSLGGIIIAIGAMVDADIVICENIFARLSRTPPHRGGAPPDHHGCDAGSGQTHHSGHAHYHPLLRADLRAAGNGGQTLLADRLHECLRNGGGVDRRGVPCSDAVRLLPRRYSAAR